MEPAYSAELCNFLSRELYRRSTIALLAIFQPLAIGCFVLSSGITAPRLPAALGAHCVALLLFVGVFLTMRRVPPLSAGARRRIRAFVVVGAVLGTTMAMVNFAVIPLLGAEPFAIAILTVTATMAAAAVALAPSTATYAAFLLPNMGSILLIASQSITLRNVPLMSLVLVVSTGSLLLMNIHTNRTLRKVAILGMRHRDANEEMIQRNESLECLNHALADTQSQLLQSEKMASVGQLAAGVAHEINNPIGYVRSNMCTLRDYMHRIMAILDVYEDLERSLPPGAAALLKPVIAARTAADLAYVRIDAPQLIEESLDGVSRVDKIVQDLKSFSRIDNNDWQITDIHLALETSLSMAAHQLKYKAEIIKEYGPSPDIECLPFQLNQVFLNLLVNAGQAIETKGTVTIRTGGDAHNAWVQVSDSGHGIAREHLHRIFDPFFTTKPVGIGTGLGLSVSYSIVKKHGGTIEVDSVPGQGTTFTVRLPARQDHTHDDAGNEAAVTGDMGGGAHHVFQV